MLKAYDHRDVAICGCGTVGQMADHIRAVQKFRKMTLEESAEVRKRAVVGAGVFTGPTLEYWKERT
jgi:threonine dehydrogenase-like Zn-dependent dehydrogenase